MERRIEKNLLKINFPQQHPRVPLYLGRCDYTWWLVSVEEPIINTRSPDGGGGLGMWQSYRVPLWWPAGDLPCCLWQGGGRHEVSRKISTHMDTGHPRRTSGRGRRNEKRAFNQSASQERSQFAGKVFIDTKLPDIKTRSGPQVYQDGYSAEEKLWRISDISSD